MEVPPPSRYAVQLVCEVTFEWESPTLSVLKFQHKTQHKETQLLVKKLCLHVSEYLEDEEEALKEHTELGKRQQRVKGEC